MSRQLFRISSAVTAFLVIFALTPIGPVAATERSVAARAQAVLAPSDDHSGDDYWSGTITETGDYVPYPGDATTQGTYTATANVAGWVNPIDNGFGTLGGTAGATFRESRVTSSSADYSDCGYTDDDEFNDIYDSISQNATIATTSQSDTGTGHGTFRYHAWIFPPQLTGRAVETYTSTITAPPLNPSAPPCYNPPEVTNVTDPASFDMDAGDPGDGTNLFVDYQAAINTDIGSDDTSWSGTQQWPAKPGGYSVTVSWNFTITPPNPCDVTASSNTATARVTRITPALAINPVANTCGFTITSPPAGGIIAMTDGKYLQPQPTDSERAPVVRTLTVTGTGARGSVTVNNIAAKVSGDGSWTVELPVGSGPLTLFASDEKGDSAMQNQTLFDPVIVNPAENDEVHITADVALQPLKATAQIVGLDVSSPTYSWKLEAHGREVEKVGKKGAFFDYPKPGQTMTVAAGTSAGDKPWSPKAQTIVGGVGRLSYQLAVPQAVDPQVTSEPRWITISGENPGMAAVEKEADAALPKFKDTINHIICRESHFQQFDPNPLEREGKTINVPDDLAGPAGGHPQYGPPAGTGVAKDDPSPFPNVQWNWHANLALGIKTFKEKKAVAVAWPASERTRLAKRGKTLLADVNKRLVAAGKPKITLPSITVPAETDAQIADDTIRLYNGGHERYFDADYVETADGMGIEVVGDQTWLTNPDPGSWGKASTDLTERTPWDEVPKVDTDYVNQVKACTPV